MNQSVVLPAKVADEEFLAEAERQIRGYGKLVISSIVEIGRHLVAVREHFTEGDGRYTAFVTQRLGWSMMSAQRFVQVHKLFLAQQIVASELTIAASALYRIAAPSTPPEVRDQVLVKAASAEGVSRSEVEQMIAEARRAQGPKKRDRTTEEWITELEAAFGITVDPNNAFFPMMDDNEMAGLAASIKANGLYQPIALDHTGKVLIDGKCRLAACKLAGVEPRFKRLNADEDPAAYNVSVNISRAHHTPSQKAMAVALWAAKDPKWSWRDEPGLANFAGGEVSITMAESVLKYSPGLAEAVKHGLPLVQAFEDMIAKTAATAALDARRDH